MADMLDLMYKVLIKTNDNSRTVSFLNPKCDGSSSLMYFNDVL